MLAARVHPRFTDFTFPPPLPQGRYELLSLSGSFVPVDDDSAFDGASPGAMPRTGALSVSLASSSGTVVGGGVAGKLLAASHVQVRVCGCGCVGVHACARVRV